MKEFDTKNLTNLSNNMLDNIGWLLSIFSCLYLYNKRINISRFPRNYQLLYGIVIWRNLRLKKMILNYSVHQNVLKHLHVYWHASQVLNINIVNIKELLHTSKFNKTKNIITRSLKISENHLDTCNEMDSLFFKTRQK